MQRDQDARATDAATPAAVDSGRGDDMADAILSTVDGAAVAEELRRDAAAQGGGPSTAGAETGDSVTWCAPDSKRCSGRPDPAQQPDHRTIAGSALQRPDRSGGRATVPIPP